ncbi:MAG: sugar transferase [Lachnospiraceae bacterium]|nr:sugar transferase [Lachnospiraceae bacterium]
MYRHFFKRLFDIVGSIILIWILVPVYLIISVVVMIYMGRPVLFSQMRIGKNEKPFRLYKFRSMTNETDENGKLLGDQQRLTKAGIALRSSSLDELPELFAILKGEMSFVGPRPLPTYYGPYFLEEERKRHKVRGGLIPPDVLCGETTPAWETQFEYDVYYAENVSLWLDIKVIFATFKILFMRMKSNYGAEGRQHLDEYRSYMDAKREEINE